MGDKNPGFHLVTALLYMFFNMNNGL